MIASIAIGFGSLLPSQSTDQQNELTPDEVRAGWVLLFDGKTSRGWRSPSSDQFPHGYWRIEDGFLPGEAVGSRAVDLQTAAKFRNFEIQFEWKIAQGGKSTGSSQAAWSIRWSMSRGIPTEVAAHTLRGVVSVRRSRPQPRPAGWASQPFEDRRQWQPDRALAQRGPCSCHRHRLRGVSSRCFQSSSQNAARIGLSLTGGSNRNPEPHRRSVDPEYQAQKADPSSIAVSDPPESKLAAEGSPLLARPLHRRFDCFHKLRRGNVPALEAKAACRGFDTPFEFLAHQQRRTQQSGNIAVDTRPQNGFHSSRAQFFER